MGRELGRENGHPTIRRTITGLVVGTVLLSTSCGAPGHRPRTVARPASPTTQPAATSPSAAPKQGATTLPPRRGLHVVGNHLVDGNQAIVKLHGVNRAGTEYACIHGKGVFDGPSDDASVAAMAGWHVNAVRIPLNEDCWLGINGVSPAYSGATYQQAIVGFVNLLHAHGIYAELSLIWGAPGTNQATYQSGGPDEDHAPAMWSSMAATFAKDKNVILAPWGETSTGWTCFMQTGCNDQATYGPNNVGYQTAPMTQAVAVMRTAGYHGVIAIPCINYANSCGTLPDGSEYNGSTWLLSHPTDPDGQLIAEAHVYGKNGCATTACFDSSMLPITQQFPLIWAETGETYDASDCGSSFIQAFLSWADAHVVGYLPWTWDTWGTCSALISDYAGTPDNAYGSWVKAHYAAFTASAPLPAG